jgi:hypothetical protein
MNADLGSRIAEFTPERDHRVERTFASKTADLFCVLLVFVTSVAAQESPSDWIKRILDPASIGVTPYPESQLNRKITIDTIKTEDPGKRIAVYFAPLDKMKAATDHFTKTLNVEPQVFDMGTPRERYLFKLAGEGKYPAKAEGLTVLIMKSPWVDDRTQITMEYVAAR